MNLKKQKTLSMFENQDFQEKVALKIKKGKAKTSKAYNGALIVEDRKLAKNSKSNT